MTICLNMIVKNEAPIILECLESVSPFIDYWVICDTGSTDTTRGVIKTFFEEKGIPGELINHEWEDFGTNRSLALKAAEGKADYILMFDADDSLYGELPLDTIKQNPEVAGWFLPISLGNTRYDRMCLVKSTDDLKWGYKGVIHEFIYCKTKESYRTKRIDYSDAHINARTSGNRSTEDPTHKYEKDANVLSKALEDTKGLLVRYTFYTAQSYYDAGIPDKALEFYKARTTLGGWCDEVYYSLYRIALIEQTENSYLEAYKHSPHRAEPLHALARMLRLKNDFKSAYAYAKLAKHIPAPDSSSLFVSQSVYDWEIDDELAISAFWLGYRTECKTLCEQLMINDKVPENQLERIEKNLSFCLSAN